MEQLQRAEEAVGRWSTLLTTMGLRARVEKSAHGWRVSLVAVAAPLRAWAGTGRRIDEALCEALRAAYGPRRAS